MSGLIITNEPGEVKNLTPAECAAIQQQTTELVKLIRQTVNIDLVSRYLDQSRPLYDGTMDAVLPHHMAIKDMKPAKENLRYICEINEEFLEILRITDDKIEAENKRGQARQD